MLKDHLGGFYPASDLKAFVCNNRIFLFATRPPTPSVVVMEIGVDEDMWTWHTIRDAEMSPSKFVQYQINTVHGPLFLLVTLAAVTCTLSSALLVVICKTFGNSAWAI